LKCAKHCVVSFPDAHGCPTCECGSYDVNNIESLGYPFSLRNTLNGQPIEMLLGNSIDEVAQVWYGADWSSIMQIYGNQMSADLQNYAKSVSLYELAWCFGGANNDSPLSVIEKLFYKNSDPHYIGVLLSSLPKEVNTTSLLKTQTLQEFCQKVQVEFRVF